MRTIFILFLYCIVNQQTAASYKLIEQQAENELRSRKSHLVFHNNQTFSTSIKSVPCWEEVQKDIITSFMKINNSVNLIDVIYMLKSSITDKIIFTSFATNGGINNKEHLDYLFHICMAVNKKEEEEKKKQGTKKINIDTAKKIILEVLTSPLPN